MHTLKHEGRTHIKAVEKVNAHSVSDPLLKRHAEGNTHADEAAKLGTEMHPVLARVDTSMAKYAEKIKTISLTIAHTCRLWPTSSATNGKLQRQPVALPSLLPSTSAVNLCAGERTGHQVQQVHNTHYALRASQVVFCGLCGAFSEQRWSRRLSEPCKRKTGSVQMRKQRDSLMDGKHPNTGASLPKAARLLL